MYMPPGFNTVTPYFFAKDADAFVRFLVEGHCLRAIFWVARRHCGFVAAPGL